MRHDFAPPTRRVARRFQSSGCVGREKKLPTRVTIGGATRTSSPNRAQSAPRANSLGENDEQSRELEHGKATVRGVRHWGFGGPFGDSRCGRHLGSPWHPPWAGEGRGHELTSRTPSPCPAARSPRIASTSILSNAPNRHRRTSAGAQRQCVSQPRRVAKKRRVAGCVFAGTSKQPHSSVAGGLRIPRAPSCQAHGRSRRVGARASGSSR